MTLGRIGMVNRAMTALMAQTVVLRNVRCVRDDGCDYSAVRAMQCGSHNYAFFCASTCFVSAATWARRASSSVLRSCSAHPIGTIPYFLGS